MKTNGNTNNLPVIMTRAEIKTRLVMLYTHYNRLRHDMTLSPDELKAKNSAPSDTLKLRAARQYDMITGANRLLDALCGIYVGENVREGSNAQIDYLKIQWDNESPVTEKNPYDIVEIQVFHKEGELPF